MCAFFMGVAQFSLLDQPRPYSLQRTMSSKGFKPAPSSANTLTFSAKRDFGLVHHRLALPQGDDSHDDKKDYSLTMPSEKSHKRKSGMFSLGSDKNTQVVSKGRSAYGGRMNKLMQTDYETMKRDRKKAKQSSSTPPLQPKHSEIRSSPKSRSARPSPFLHQRTVKGLLGSGGDGSPRGSLENLKQLLNNASKKQANIDTGDLIRLTVASKGKDERQVTLRKSRDGLGMHLSRGPPPIYVEFLSKGGEAAAAGMKVRDEIIEVNGHNCKAMSLEQLMQLKSLLQYVGAKKSEAKDEPVEITVTSIDSDISSDNENDQHDISDSTWEKIKSEQKGIRSTETMETKPEIENEDTMKSSKPKEVKFAPKKVEMGEKEWEQMKETQDLIFNTGASSSVIAANATTSNKSTISPPKSKGQPSSPSEKKQRKWSLFTRKSDKDSKPENREQEKVKNKDQNSSGTQTPEKSKDRKKSADKKESGKDKKKDIKDTSSGKASPKSLSTATSSASVSESGKTSSKDAKVKKTSRSGGLKGFFGKSKSKIGNEETDSDLFVIPATNPVLGVSEGRSRRDVGLTRAVHKRRRPTDPQGMLAARQEALATKQSAQEVAQEKKTDNELLVDPESEINRSSYIPRSQSVSLSVSQKQHIERLISELSSSRACTQNRSSALLVAEAALLKKQRLEEQSTEQDLDGSSERPPLIKSTSADEFSRAHRRRKSVDQPKKVLSMEEICKEDQSQSTTTSTQIPSSAIAVGKQATESSTPSWVSLAKKRQKRSSEIVSEMGNLSNVDTPIKKETNTQDNKDGENGQLSVKNRMAIFQQK